MLSVCYRTPAEIMAVTAAVRDAVRAEAERGGSVALITAVALPPVAGAAVLSVREAKGLEFDAVLVVEPGPPAAGGAADLHVALTRATQRLGVLHTSPLPAGLEGLACRG